MIYPKFLSINDCIGVPAPSCGAYNDIYRNRYINSANRLEKLGYRTKVSKNINNHEKCRSASAHERAEEVNNMFADKEIDFLICAAGGEFLVECLPYIDFDKIAENPKFIEGFSDPTGILFPLTTKYDIATIYGSNFGDYGPEEVDRNLLENLEIIQGNLILQKNYDLYEEERIEQITGLESPNYTEKVEWKSIDNKNIQIKGRIIGGCFDIISELAGTKYDGVKEFNEKYKEDGIIWYFDNCELSKEEIIRVLWKFNELDYFKYTKCVIFGRNGAETSCIGYTMEEALKDSILCQKNISVIYDADISHKDPCMTIINGAIADFKYYDGKGEISFELK